MSIQLFFNKRVSETIQKLNSLPPSEDPGPNFIKEYNSLITPKNNTGERNFMDEYLRFVISTSAMKHFIRTRELTEMHSWIVRGLTNEYDKENERNHEVECDRIIAFQTHPIIRNNPWADSIITTWFGLFYFYCAEQTALDSIGNYLLPAAIHQLNLTPTSEYQEQHVFLLSRLLTWTLQTGHATAKNLTTLIENIALTKNKNRRINAAAAITLSTRSGRISRFNSTYWANHALTYYSPYLSDLESFQQYQLLWDGRSKKASSRLLTAVRKLRRSLDNIVNSKQHRQLLEDGQSEFIKPIIVKALEVGNAIFTHSIICIWYGIEKKCAPDPNSILWQIPQHGDGLLFVHNTNIFKIPRDTQDELIRITDASNRFLGTSVSVRGTPSDDLHVPERMGHPLHDLAPEYASAVESTYLPNEIVKMLSARLDCIEQQIIIPSKPHPIQAAQLKVLKKTWPLTASYTQPFPDAKIRRAAIWSTGNLLGNDYELSLVTEIFKREGVSVDIFNTENLGDRPFIEVYRDVSYDVLWLISHGEYNHYSPKEAYLSLGENHSVGINELLENTPVRSDRRLFVMNICDGASHAGEGVLPRIGLSPAIASSSQAVISHKWPISVIPAAAFGALLARQLMTNTGFFLSYASTLSAMINSSNNFSIPDETTINSPHAIELNDKIQRSQNKLNLFEHFGSAAFFQ